MKKIESFFEDKLHIPFKVVKYCLSSFSSSCVEFLFFFLLTSVFFKDYANIILIATIVARLIGSLINFLINKFWCFMVFNRTIIQAIEYSILFIVKLYLSYFFVNMLVNRYGINPTLIKVPVDFTLFFLGYVVQNFIIFRKKKEENK